MSPGDQLIALFIETFGIVLSTMVAATFDVFFVPILEWIATAFGIMS